MTDRVIDHEDLLQITSDIVSAHVSNNPLPLGELPGLIQTVYSTLTGLSAPAPEPEVELTPAVNPKRSVTDDYIVCLEDGKKLKMLKRHLATSVRHDARRIPGEVGTAARLSDGGAGLCEKAPGACQKDRARTQAAPRRGRARATAEGKAISRKDRSLRRPATEKGAAEWPPF